jgi:hypothetical protein
MFETIIDDFLYLIKAHPELFADDQTDLDHLVETLPAAAEAVADAIALWLEQRPTLKDAILTSLQEGKVRGFLTDKTPASDAKRDYGELIRNQVRSNSAPPPTAPQPPNPKDEQPPTT